MLGLFPDDQQARDLLDGIGICRRCLSRDAALEIGCGPGRLVRPMSRHFGEIHGIDVSDEMIAQARANLHDIPHARLHHTSGSDLALGPCGNAVVIQHSNGIETGYCHMSRFARNMRVGAHVQQGEIIGYVGMTGLATGPHLHYEYLVNGVHKNPQTVQLPGA